MKKKKNDEDEYDDDEDDDNSDEIGWKFNVFNPNTTIVLNKGKTVTNNSSGYNCCFIKKKIKKRYFYLVC